MKMVLHPDFKTAKEFVENLPNEFQKSRELIYQARNQLKIMHFGENEFVVKSFRQPHLINRIAYTFFRKSKARRSYEYSLRLLDNGVSTPEPVAYIEIKSNGLLSESYFINKYAENFSHIREQMYGNQIADGFIPALVKYVSEMQSKGILHKDLSPGNILFKESKKGFEFCVLDINPVSYTHLTLPTN
jgi:serine/threonine protein kinase